MGISGVGASVGISGVGVSSPGSGVSVGGSGVGLLVITGVGESVITGGSPPPGMISTSVASFWPRRYTVKL